MKDLKSSMYVAAFVLLICLFAPYIAHAQDDGGVPWCNALNRSNFSDPWCHALNQNESLIPQSHYEFAQASAQVPQLHYSLAGIARSTRGEIRYQYAFFEGRRHELALIRR